jgi:YHS domain-containing protein
MTIEVTHDIAQQQPGSIVGKQRWLELGIHISSPQNTVEPRTSTGGSSPPMKTITTDPVCGTEVDDSSALRAMHKGVTYRFCCEHCCRTFLRDPGEFLSDEEESEPSWSSNWEKVRQIGRGAKWIKYLPLAVVVTLTLAAACAKQVAYGGWDWMSWMHDFMGFFLVVFSMFKLFDLEGFADGFQMYDLLAKQLRPYARVYPFIELALGLGYLSHWQPATIYTATVVVMVFGSFGVFVALRKGLDVECPCMGTVLRLPLSMVALLENLGMAAMATAMLARVWSA